MHARNPSSIACLCHAFQVIGLSRIPLAPSLACVLVTIRAASRNDNEVNVCR